MRYHPLDAKEVNKYVGEHWSDSKLINFMRYWSNRIRTRPIPFKEFGKKGVDKNQLWLKGLL
jgi:hypothetical protein